MGFQIKKEEGFYGFGERYNDMTCDYDILIFIAIQI